MTRRFWLIMPLLGLTMGAVSPLPAATLAERLLTSYDDVRTLTCEIRRDTESGGRRVRFLSRISKPRRGSGYRGCTKACSAHRKDRLA